MELSDFLLEIDGDIIDLIDTDFEYVTTANVPNRSDSVLSFERGVNKKGKILKTCVLYVDIRNSVGLTQKHSATVMGKIYTAFAKSVVKAAKRHSGHIRNIIGDRVMIIFPSENCFTNAVDCAITINHIASKVINTRFTGVDFKCGIGIDYGEMKVIKVGIHRRGTEAIENKSLVWTGNPANIASRLTDVANKTVEEEIFRVTRKKINPRAIKPLIDITSILGGSSYYDPNAPFYLDEIETVDMTSVEFSNSIAALSNGQLYMTGGNFIKFEKRKRNKKFPAILMTKAVFNEFKNANPERKCIRENYWELETEEINNVSQAVYGSNLTWVVKK